MVGRSFWVLARDDATPFSKYFSQVNERLSCPIQATVLCAILCTAFGAIQLGTKAGFNALVGSFIILTTMSYLLAILPHLLSKRQNTPKGPFWMGDAGFVVNGIACVLIVFFNIFFCFPYAYPVAISVSEVTDGVTTTGLIVPISANTGIGTGRSVAAFQSASPPRCEPVNATAAM